MPQNYQLVWHNHRSRPLAGTQDGLWQSPTDFLSLFSQDCLHFQQGLGGDQQSLWLTKPFAVLGAGKGALLCMWMDGVVAGFGRMASICSFLVFTQTAAVWQIPFPVFKNIWGIQSHEAAEMLVVNQPFLSHRFAVTAVRPTDEKIKRDSWPHTLWLLIPLTQTQKRCLLNQQA